MRIDLAEDGELVLQATSFKESRALAILYQRVSAMRSIAQDVIAWEDRIFLDDTGKTLAFVWSPEQEADQ